MAEFPSSEESILRVLGNGGLARSLPEKGPALLCSVDLLEDPARPGRYRWSSTRGSDFPLSSGTTCRADVVVRTERPASLVLPSLRRWAGL